MAVFVYPRVANLVLVALRFTSRAPIAALAGSLLWASMLHAQPGGQAAVRRSPAAVTVGAAALTATQSADARFTAGAPEVFAFPAPRHAETVDLRGVHEHAAQLAATHDAQPGVAGDRCGCRRG